jgi:hypothetical protein
VIVSTAATCLGLFLYGRGIFFKFTLDATRKTASVDRRLLYTIVVRHSFTGTGCPVVSYFTKVYSARSITEFYLL